MRIGAGRLRGLKLSPVGAAGRKAGLRPTSSKLRASIFDLLTHGPDGDLLTGLRFLDLFAGTGAVGLEAVSRGAAFATLVERGGDALRVLERNVRLSGLGESVSILRADAARLGASRTAAFDVVFVDAPYGRGLEAKALESAADGGWIAANGIAVVEAPEPFPVPDGMETITRRGYGRTAVTLLRRSGRSRESAQPD